MTVAVILQIIVPDEQVFGERIEIQRVGIAAVFTLALLFEFHGKAGLPCPVIGIEKNTRDVRQITAQLDDQIA